MFERKELSRDEVLLTVVGSLTGENVNEFHRQVEELIGESYSTITLDLSGTSTINSSALGKILLFKKKLAEARRTFQIRGCSDTLFKTFQMIKFDSLISITK